MNKHKAVSLARVIYTKTGRPRVLNSYDLHHPIIPITLPPIVPITAEEVWMVRLEEIQRLQTKAADRCPPGARVVPVYSCRGLDVPEFAIVDKEDFERVSPHYWRCSKRHGKLHAWTNIPGEVYRCELGRFILGVRYRHVSVRHLGDNLDCRKSNLKIERIRAEDSL